jgi:hypothetical protein
MVIEIKKAKMRNTRQNQDWESGRQNADAITAACSPLPKKFLTNHF